MNNKHNAFGFSTRAIHHGYDPKDHHGALVPPIYLSATFAFPTAEYGAACFAGEESGHFYTRISNPTLALLESRMATLENGEAAVAFSSGMGAIAATFWTLLRPGDEIIVSEMEHHSNIVPWHLLRERRGAVLKWISVLDDGSLDMTAYADLLGPKTRMVAVTHMSNVLGTINPVAEITRLAHAAGAQVLIDGCQGAVHATPDVQAIGCDFYVLTGHKLFGPTGIGALYGKAEALEALPPYQGGGEMIETVEMDRVTYARPPHRFEAGTPPILEAIGLGVALEWLAQYDQASVRAHEHSLYQHAVDRLQGQNWLRILGQAEGKGAILTFAVEGAHAHDVAQIMDRYGVAVRAGQHCAEPLAKRMGVTSSTRASFALYNTMEDADAFVDALIKARNFFV